MGKRKKAARKPVRRINAPLDKTFRCLFCQHQGTVFCKMDKGGGFAQLECRDCAQTFSTPITHLTEPVDVYSEWIDACEAVNAKARAAERAPKRRRPSEDDLDRNDVEENGDNDDNEYNDDE